MPPRLAGHVPLVLIAAVAAACSVRAAPPAPAENRDATLVVHVTDGGTFSGLLDWESDDAELRLDSIYDDGIIIRSLAWPQISQVEFAGRSYAAALFREALKRVRAAAPPTPLLPSWRHFHGITGPAPDESAADTASSHAEDRDAPVVSLDIEANVARWDANVENDGLAVQIMPADAYGRIIPVEATLDVELIAEPVGMGRPGTIELPNTPPRCIARWQQPVHPADFARPWEQYRLRNGAAYLLRYQEPNPEFDRRFGSYAAVHVRLSVPGQGVFESTRDFVRIRPYSPIRDRLEATTGHRFLPQERTGDGRL